MQVKCYISVSPVIMSPEVTTGYVSFWTSRPGEVLYAPDPELAGEELRADIGVTDCDTPFPTGAAAR